MRKGECRTNTHVYILHRPHEYEFKNNSALSMHHLKFKHKTDFQNVKILHKLSHSQKIKVCIYENKYNELNSRNENATLS